MTTPSLTSENVVTAGFERHERVSGRSQDSAAPGRFSGPVCPARRPAADLAVIVGASRTRRQMVQRMGRVLRVKGGRAVALGLSRPEGG